MRIAVAIGLLAVSGCNQIWGLEGAKPIEVDAGPDSAFSKIALSYQVAQTTSEGAEAPPVRAPLPGLASVRVGPLMTAELVEQPYNAGDVDIPDAIFQMPWRLVFQPPDDVEHEYHLRPFSELIQVTVPRLSRLDRAPVPGNAGVRLTIDNYASTASERRMYSTGIWTEATPTYSAGARQFRAAFSCPPETPGCTTATSLDGPLAAPAGSRGDAFVIMDFAPFMSDAECVASTGSSTAASLDLVAGNDVVGTATWTTTLLQADLQNAVALVMRATKAPGTGATNARYRIGYLATTQMSGFTQTPAERMFLPGPLMLESASCSFNKSVRFAESADLARNFTLGFHTEAARDHVLSNGARIVSGITAVGSIEREPASAVLDIQAPAPFPSSPAVDGTALPFDESITIARPDTLTFTADNTNGDYWEVVLHELTGATLTKRRVIIVPGNQAAVTVDLKTTAFTAGKQYIFELRSYTGRGGARDGRFDDATLPQSMAVSWTGSFTVN